MSESLTKFNPQDIALEDYADLISMMCGIPPSSLLINATKDQKQRWQGVQTRYLLLKESLAAYFHGEADPQTVELDSFLAELKILDKDCWRTFYTLIQYAWALITEHNPEFAGIGLTSPGKALAAAIKQKGDYHVSPAFDGYYRFTPDSRRKLFSQAQKKARGEATPKQAKKVEAEIKQLAHRLYQYCWVETLCVETCQDALKKPGKKDHHLRRYLTEYKKAQTELSQFFRDMLSTRKKIKGYEYRKGIAHQMGHAGGKPVS